MAGALPRKQYATASCAKLCPAGLNIFDPRLPAQISGKLQGDRKPLMPSICEASLPLQVSNRRRGWSTTYAILLLPLPYTL